MRKTIYKKIYKNIRGLGCDVPPKGPCARKLIPEFCVSSTAFIFLNITSDGIIRLVIIPALIRPLLAFGINDPSCSKIPPIIAMPYAITLIIPVLTVDKIELDVTTRDKSVIGPRSKKNKAFKIFDISKTIFEPIKIFSPIIVRNSMELYMMTTIARPINFPNTISYLFIGFDKMAYIAPLSISPEIAFMDISTTRKAIIKLAKYNPADKSWDSIIILPMSGTPVDGNAKFNPYAYMAR